MDRFYGCNTCTANTTNTDNEIQITHEVIAEYLHSLELLIHITCIQISTCHRYVSIRFKDRDIMENFCEEEHFITNEPITFTPDYQKKIRISMENIPIELQDTKIRTFLSHYVTLVGNTYYPGKRYENTHFITGTRVYFCTTITNHLPKHIYKFGRYLRIRYDNEAIQNQQQQNEEIIHDNNININNPESNNSKIEDTHTPKNHDTPIITNNEEEIPQNITILQQETPNPSKTKKLKNPKKQTNL